MNMYSITINKLFTVEAQIININPPSGEQLRLNLNRNIRKQEDSSFICILTITICRESDADKTDLDYLVKYAISAHIECDDPSASAEDLQDTITRELYPHLRAGISAVMGAAGIEPILLPVFSI